MDIFSNDGACKNYEKIGTTTTAIGFTTAKIALTGGSFMEAKTALITVETASVRITMDGTTPTVTAGTGAGHLVDVGQSYVVRGIEAVRNFRCINAVASSGAVVHCSYFF